MQLNSIRTKSLAVLIPLFIISFAILAGISYYLANRSLEESSQKWAEEMGSKFSWQIKYDVDQKMHVLQELAANPAFRGSDTALKVKVLADAKDRNKFPSMMVLDAQGNGYSTDGKPLKRGDREYVKRVIQTQKSYVPQPILSAITNTMTVVLTTPIYDNGKMIGMITGTIDLGELSQTLGNVTFMQSGYGYLVDSSGLVLAHPKNPDYINKLNVLATQSSGAAQTGGKLDEQLVMAFKQVFESGKQQNVHYINFDGAEHKAIITPVDLSDKRWAMVVTTPVAEIQAEAVQLANIMAGISCIFILLAIVVIFVFARRIASDVTAIRDECTALNQGDLTKRPLAVEAADEIGQLARGFQTMRQTLHQLICQVQEKSNNVAAASEQLNASAAQSAEAANQVSGSITNIAQGVEQQSQAADQVTLVAQKISGHAESVSVKAQEIVNIASAATQNAGRGRASIAQAVTQMQQIGTGATEIEGAITELASGSKEIGNIVALISNIADQTNLLALNAAIEAARAGEAGRGFAVVADEVRKLAEESNQSSKKIGQLVQKNQLDMAKAVSAAKLGTEGVAHGMEAVQAADETFKDIVQAIEGLSAEISMVSGGIKEMAEGGKNMLTAIEAIDTISQKNSSEAQSVSSVTEEQSASMEEIATASRSLSTLADELQRAVEQFRLER